MAQYDGVKASQNVLLINVVCKDMAVILLPPPLEETRITPHFYLCVQMVSKQKNPNKLYFQPYTLNKV